MAYELSVMGITGIQRVANLLADFGRFGDGYFVHTAEGETVVPLAVLDENPRLKQALFTQMREMGLEPERYIVGNELNSINPVTGQPEFFLKSFFKGVKKVIKAVAPIVLPVVFSATPLGPILGSAFGAGIGSAIAGRSAKDSLRNALITGGIAGLWRGFNAPEGDFTGQIKKDIGSPWKRLTSTLGVGPRLPERPDYWRSPFQFGPPAPRTPAPIVDRSLTGGTQPVTTQSFPMGPRTAESGGLSLETLKSPSVASIPPGTLDQLIDQQNASMFTPGHAVEGGDYLFNAAVNAPVGTSGYTKDPGFLGALGKGDLKQAFFPQKVTANDILISKGFDPYTATPAMARAAEIDALRATPGLVRSYGPLVGAGLGLLAATGGFKPGKEPEPFDPYGGETGRSLLEEDPARYSAGVPGVFEPALLSDVSTATTHPFTGQAGGPIESSRFQAERIGQEVTQRLQGFQEGGAIDYPPRVGPIYGPGTGTSDDVPAMLSDGEYVMTADAVRGAGNGNRQQGMRNMYDMMRQFEGRVA
jgi:hypothetical protein